MQKRLNDLDKAVLCDIYFKAIDGEWDERMGDKPEWWDEYEEVVVRPAKTTLFRKREKEPAVVERRYKNRERLRLCISDVVGYKALYCRSLEWAGIAENGELYLQCRQEELEYWPKLHRIERQMAERLRN